MFEPLSRPRVFALPPGVDFSRALVQGLVNRMSGQPPEALARVQVYVNTRRMQRRLREIFDKGPARLLPRIRVITDLAADAAPGETAPEMSPLRRRLELMQLVAGLLSARPDLAPRGALFGLADSLARLLDEMQGEGVAPGTLQRLDVSDQSGHWQNSLEFLSLVEKFLGGDSADREARQRRAVERLAESWKTNPPDTPVIVAGSTGSRGTTALFLQAVARLPQGAVVVPGFDFDLPAKVWDQLEDPATGEDHPQFRFARLMSGLGIGQGDIAAWVDTAAVAPERNRLVSLALRPAPVTDQWLDEGPRLKGLAEATGPMTLIEAPSSRAEASAIALILREACENGRRAALITPDRVLTRQVAAALDRWRIVPDDSAGRPLALSAPGRFLRHVAALFGTRLTSEALLTLLKHPLCSTGGADRGTHLLNTRELELSLRRRGPPFPTAADLIAWAGQDAGRLAWATWVGDALDGVDAVATRPLEQHLSHHLNIAETLAAGTGGTGTGELWAESAGIEARRLVGELIREAGHGGALSPVEYQSLFNAILAGVEVREPITAHPGISIWGTLEARVQGADLVILGGLNEGVWPSPPDPDPWLNRALRHRAGLLLPERQIGLSAHDFQQAIAAPQVVLTRSIRDAEAQTVPSRWLSRLTNLLRGLPEQGEASMQQMLARGADWLRLAETLDTPQGERPMPAPRPSPRPPVAARPQEISVTEVQTLIRDPYAVYARRILGLKALDPIRHAPDAPLRGTVMHLVFERFVGTPLAGDPAADRARLLAVADEVLAAEASWPAARRLWRARIERLADWFIEGETARQARRKPLALEHRGRLRIDDLNMVLTGKADRIDEAVDHTLALYDYKTGQIPSEDQQAHFDKQLLLSAAMAEAGAIEGVTGARVVEVGYIGLGASPKFEPVTLENGATAKVMEEFRRLMSSYGERARGYTSRRAIEKRDYVGDYDHLARFGEWDESDAPRGEAVGE